MSNNVIAGALRGAGNSTAPALVAPGESFLEALAGRFNAPRGGNETVQWVWDGFAPLDELIAQFVENDGRLWACGACAKPRGITEADLVAGANIVEAASAIEALVSGAQTLSW